MKQDSKSFLKTTLEKLTWQEIYDEYYGDLSEDEKIILDSESMPKHFYSKTYYKYVVSKNSIKKDS